MSSKHCVILFARKCINKATSKRMEAKTADNKREDKGVLHTLSLNDIFTLVDNYMLHDVIMRSVMYMYTYSWCVREAPERSSETLRESVFYKLSRWNNFIHILPREMHPVRAYWNGRAIDQLCTFPAAYNSSTIRKQPANYAHFICTRFGNDVM